MSSPSIRKTRTSSGSTAVQVVRYENRKIIILKHIGSGRTEMEITALIQSAESWIRKNADQQLLFPATSDRIIHLNTCRFLGVKYTFAYKLLSNIADQCGFSSLRDKLLLDLAIMRIFEPCSKLRSITLLERFFGIRHSERTVYRALPLMISRKAEVERLVVSFAKKNLSCGLSFVLYDVTTLYFESFEQDDLRKFGFSKDNKANQPQVVIGLLVNPQGFPLGYDVFKGNTFEGHTMIPVINAFRKMNKVKTCTVVADAAMMGLTNLDALKKEGLTYIVGARTANLSPLIIAEISDSLKQEDGKTIRKMTDHGELLFEFSAKRFRKDKSEMEKQIAKAKMLVASKEQGRRAKFVTVKNGVEYILNFELMKKTERLLGIKGYYTNIPKTQAGDQDILDHYRNLWHVEQSFRMTKSDLAARPIFHHRDEAVKTHILICFMALVMGKLLEIKTGLSLRRVIDLLWSVTDAHIVDTVTHDNIILRSEISEDVKTIFEKLPAY